MVAPLQPRKPISEHCKKLHDAACARSEEFYTDPDTGYMVATRIKLLARGFCCELGCRHCPYQKIVLKRKT